MNGLFPLTKSIAFLLVASMLSLGQQATDSGKCKCTPPPSGAPLPGGPPRQGPFGHPHPQIRPQLSTEYTVGDTTYVQTGVSLFAESDPFRNPPGTNFLPTVYTNMFDGAGNEMPNTLPSTPSVPYNLHDGDPVVTR